MVFLCVWQDIENWCLQKNAGTDYHLEFLHLHWKSHWSKVKLNSFFISTYPRRFLQTSIFKDRLRAQKDHNSNEIFVMGPAQCAGPMTKISLLLWSFCACGWTLKIDACKKLLGQFLSPRLSCSVWMMAWQLWKLRMIVLRSCVARAKMLNLQQNFCQSAQHCATALKTHTKLLELGRKGGVVISTRPKHNSLLSFIVYERWQWNWHAYCNLHKVTVSY